MSDVGQIGRAPDSAAGTETTSIAARTAARWGRVRRWVVPVVVIAVLVIALRVLWFESRHLRYHEVVRALQNVPLQQVLLAVLCTFAGYLVLPAYDYLALIYAGHRRPWRQVAYSSTVTYGISQTLGFAALTGGSVRVRLWSAWGLDTDAIARAVAFSGTTFTLGMVALVGIVGVGDAPAGLERLHLPVIVVRVLATLCVGVTAAYVAWSIVSRGRTRRLLGVDIVVPRPPIVAAQYLVAILDWTIASLVLYVLLPAEHGLHFPTFVAAFLLAQSAGLLSHVPGGLGVFDSLMLLQIDGAGAVPTEQVLGALVAYRVIFYLLPFSVAVALLVVHEGRRQAARVGRTVSAIAAGYEQWAEPLLPQALGIMTMIGGGILLVSGATPAVRGRMSTLVDVLPLGVVELSHFAGSVAGVGLLVLGWALTHRLDAAYQLSRIVLAVGIAASLLKGLDYEEASVLTMVLLLLVAGRKAFYRRSALLAEPLSPGWIAAIVAVVAGSMWLGVFAFKHVDYSNDLWWRFAEHGDAPRALRASAGAAIALAGVGLMRLMRHAAPVSAAPTADELQHVIRLIPTIAETSAALALLGDKQLMIAEAKDGFLMYGTSGRTWVALGDPLGSEQARRELAWRFREEADRHGGWPVFYEVSAPYLPLYIDLGLTLLKMGEEAQVPLSSFTLDGAGRKGLRRTQRDLQKAGATFEIVEAAQVPALLPELRAISDDWLASKATREKGFSLGRFDDAYLSRFPHALVRLNGRFVAFANLWVGNGSELSFDLMRYHHDAPRGVMEYLFIEIMLWGREHGFERMSLGMAPLSGLEQRSLATAWHRLGGLVYRHGEHFYNFRGLRAYKEKFDPVWEPRYLATPVGLALPRVLANVASLISGGITGMFRK